MSAEIVGVIIGGAISLLSTAIAGVFQHKENNSTRTHTEKLRLMEKREMIYMALAKELDEIEVVVIPDENNSHAIRFDSATYKTTLLRLETTMQAIQGEVTLYASNAVRKKIHELKADIYKLSTGESSKSIPMKEIKESQAYSTVVKAQTLVNLLRKELGITDN